MLLFRSLPEVGPLLLGERNGRRCCKPKNTKEHQWPLQLAGLGAVVEAAPSNKEGIRTAIVAGKSNPVGSRTIIRIYG
jgi:hypothetical protein